MKKRHIIILSLCLLAFWGKPQLAAAQFFSAKVNALAALTGTVNVGLDAAVADKWTLDLSAYWNPINSDSFRSARNAGFTKRSWAISSAAS